MKTKRAVAVLGTLALGSGLTLAFGPSPSAMAGAPVYGFNVLDVANPIGEGDGPPPPATPLTVPMTFHINSELPNPVDCELVVHTVDGTAHSGSDYLAYSQTLLVPAGTTDLDVVVQITSDTVFEPAPDESLYLQAAPGISANPVGCVVIDGEGVGYIDDDDPPGILTLNMDPDRQVCEAALPTGTVTARLQMNRVLDNGEELHFSLTTVNGQASAPGDFTQESFPYVLVGPTVDNFVEVQIPITDDFTPELLESFDVALENVVYTGTHGHLIGDAFQTIFIKDDDIPGNSVWIDDDSVNEGTGGNNTHLHFTVHSAFPAICDGLVVGYHTEDGTANDGLDPDNWNLGEDYEYEGTWVVIPTGNTSADIDIEVNPDTLIELDETMYVVIDGPTGIVGDLSATGTIVDDDFPTVNVDNSAVVEGTGGTTTMYFEVTLTDPSPWTIDVAYHTEDGTATSPSDYTGGSSTVSFAPFQTVAYIGVNIVTDSTPEENEYLWVELDGGLHVNPGDTEAYGYIYNDDDWVVSAVDAVVAEGTPPDPNHAVNVLLQLNAPAPSQGFYIDWELDDDTATAGLDYVDGSGTAHIVGGSSSTTVPAVIIPDDIPEPSETLIVDLLGGGVELVQDCWGGCFNLVVAPDGDGIVTIIDDDPEDLPETGMNMLPFELMGFGLMGAGLVLVFGTRRRRVTAN